MDARVLSKRGEELLTSGFLDVAKHSIELIVPSELVRNPDGTVSHVHPERSSQFRAAKDD